MQASEDSSISPPMHRKPGQAGIEGLEYKQKELLAAAVDTAILKVGRGQKLSLPNFADFPALQIDV